jgi:hypothetical protein
VIEDRRGVVLDTKRVHLADVGGTVSTGT